MCDTVMVVIMVVSVLLSRLSSGSSFGVVNCLRKFEQVAAGRQVLASTTLRTSTVASSLPAPPAVGGAIPVGKETEANSASDGYRKLVDLASKVVHGIADKAIPSGSRLKRRRSWELFLEPANHTTEYTAEAAILVVNKKSSFTLEDARLALAIILDEIAARRLPLATTAISTHPVNRHVLVATRSGVAPAADAFIRGLQGNSDGDAADYTTIIRWEKLASLLENGALGSFLATSQASSGGVSGSPKGTLFALPPWLVAEREKERRERGERLFDMEAPFEPSGDQPEAIEALNRGLAAEKRYQTLLGATGTGKTFIIANVIQNAARPTLVLAPNKVLAAQLTNELRALFPRNAVEYFVSYYDYFMPEAFNSATDSYIDKVVLVNDDIDRMRHSATRSLLERRDVIVVASASLDEAVVCALMRIHSAATVASTSLNDGHRLVQAIGRTNKITQGMVLLARQVSCIYGLGMPSKYLQASIRIAVGQKWDGGWRSLAQHLEKNMYYEPQYGTDEFAKFDTAPRGKFRLIPSGRGGGVIETGPAADETIVSVHFDGKGIVSRVHVRPTGNSVEQIGGTKENLQALSAVLAAGGIGIDGQMGQGAVDMMPTVRSASEAQTVPGGDVEAHVIYPAKHHVIGDGEMETILEAISSEMEERCAEFGKDGMVLEAERLRQRTENDMMLLRAVGTCKGVENYSRQLAVREAGDAPETLVDYFPEDDWLLVVDESHVSAAQLGAMHGGNLARKIKLVEHGFRLPSALDNRPLTANEFWSKVPKAIFLSATPGTFELELSNPNKLRLSTDPDPEEFSQYFKPKCSSGKGGGGGVRWGWDEIGNLVDAQAVIRPTGITDPPVDIRPSEGQVADLVRECRVRRERGERVLVTALTKRMAEDLCAFLLEQGVPTAYLHSDVKPMQRLELLRQLRSGKVDVLVGVNLLREGLNLPEVSLVCILDADAEGFLRSDTALLQTIGRATRHQAGRAVLYADRITPSMKRALAETDRRRHIQIKHNHLHGITPSVAVAASVGDSLLDSIAAGRDRSSTDTRTARGEGERDLDNAPSWADPVLPPDQVQLLYDLAALKKHGPSRSGVSPTSISPLTAPSSAKDGRASPDLLLNAETSHALKRLSKQASTNMTAAASRADFKEAALWRDRRDSLLSAIRQIEDGMGLAVEEEGSMDFANR